MSPDNLKDEIEQAFAAAPPPGDQPSDIVLGDDGGLFEYFHGTTWRGHSAENLRRHSSALSFFTDKAFRYWLPAFMLAELENHRVADIIAENLAFDFTEQSHSAQKRLAQFSPRELRAIVAFLDHCSSLYNQDGCCDVFLKAAKAVRKKLEGT